MTAVQRALNDHFSNITKKGLAMTSKAREIIIPYILWVGIDQFDQKEPLWDFEHTKEETTSENSGVIYWRNFRFNYELLYRSDDPKQTMYDIRYDINYEPLYHKLMGAVVLSLKFIRRCFLKGTSKV